MIFYCCIIFAIFVEHKYKAMDDITCVDLTILNKNQLKDFCSTYKLSYKVILGFKEKTYAKIWFNKQGICIAYTLAKKNKFDVKDFDTVRIFNEFLKDLNTMKPYQVIVEPVILDVDAILEKISKHGIESITPEEKSFLDSIK